MTHGRYGRTHCWEQRIEIKKASFGNPPLAIGGQNIKIQIRCLAQWIDVDFIPEKDSQQRTPVSFQRTNGYDSISQKSIQTLFDEKSEHPERGAVTRQFLSSHNIDVPEEVAKILIDAVINLHKTERASETQAQKASWQARAGGREPHTTALG